MKHLLDKVTFAAVTMVFAVAYAYKDPSSSLAVALIVVASLAAHVWEKHQLKLDAKSDLDTLRQDLKALQDRMGRTEFSLGLKTK